MNEPVIDIRDRIEKMRNQMTPQSAKNQENSIQKPSKNSKTHIDKIVTEKETRHVWLGFWVGFSG